MFFVGFINRPSGYFPNLIVDLSSLGIIYSAYSIRNIVGNQVYKAAIILIIVPLIFYAYTIPSMDISIVQSGYFNRAKTLNAFGDTLLAGGALKGQVIYDTHGIMLAQVFLFFLLLPIFYTKFNKPLLLLLFASGVLLILLYSVYYQKRQSSLELFLIIILYGLYYRKLLRGFLPNNLLFTAIIAIGVIYFVLTSSYFENVLNRFTETAEDINSFDRKEEAVFVLSQFSFLDWVFGKGLGFSTPDTAGGAMLHIGYANLIFKGGIILLFFYLYNSINNLMYCLKAAKRHPEFYVGVVISIYSMIQLTYTGGFHWFATIIITGLAMFSRYPLKSIVHDALYLKG